MLRQALEQKHADGFNEYLTLLDFLLYDAHEKIVHRRTGNGQYKPLDKGIASKEGAPFVKASSRETRRRRRRGLGIKDLNRESASVGMPRKKIRSQRWL